MNPKMLLLLLYLGGGLLEMALAVPMIRGMVPRNYIYGFRTPKTLESDAIWYPANCYAGKAILIAGGILVAGTLLLLIAAPFVSVDTIAWAGLTLTVLPLGVAVLKCIIYLRRL
ncbi:MAG: SdpI family protein [Armatimonadetes bacterium]|nr:SdpI family protein [Armatimonadota bacterium]